MTESENDRFWTDAKSVKAVFRGRFEEGSPFVSAIGPSHFDPEKRSSLPFQFAQAGTVRDFLAGSLLKNGRIVLMDLDRNRLRICDVDVPKGDLPARPPVGQIDLEDPAFGMQTRQVDLCDDRFAGIEREVGHFRMVAILPHQQTEPVDFLVGPDEPRFSDALGLALADIPIRDSIPSALLSESKSWKAIAIRPGFPEGLDLQIVLEGGQVHAVVSVALEEMRGERLILEPGAVMSNGMKPPDAIRTVHLVACLQDGVFLASLEIPVNGSSGDSLLRGSAAIDLDRIFSGWRAAGVLSLRLFCGGWMAGPHPMPNLT